MTTLSKLSHTVAAAILLVCGLLVINATSAVAQVACPVGTITNTGLPDINGDHVFCGEINSKGKAVGFHSRPGGNNPVGGGITNVVITQPANPMGIYNISFQKNGVQKSNSTMFPDSCSRDEVVNSILYAEANQEACPVGAPGWVVCGKNRPDPVMATQGPYCEGNDASNRFYVAVGVNGGNINTAFPLR